MAVQSELDLSRERKQVDDLTAAFDRLQAGAAKTNRTNLSALEREIDSLSAGASGNLKRMLQGIKGNLQELDGMLTATGRQVGVAWKAVASDTLARVNADMSKVNAAMQKKLDAQVAMSRAAAEKLAADEASAAEKRIAVAAREAEKLSAIRAKAAASAANQGQRVAGKTDALGFFISDASVANAEKIASAAARIGTYATGQRVAGKTNVFGVFEQEVKSTTRTGTYATGQRVAGYTNALGVFIPGEEKISLKTKAINLFSDSLKRMAGDMGTVHSAARGLASGFGLLWLTWGQMLPLLTGAAISFGLNEVISSGAKVQDTLTQIKTLAGATANEVAALNQQMQTLAASGPFGPEAIANAMKTLSLAGLKANDVYAAMPELLAFAVAGTTTIEQAADALTSIGVAFGISAKNYGYVSDIISKTAAESKSSVEGISEAFKTASVINSQYGVSLQDTAVGLALLANAGITGSAAGTALRNMYADLSERTPKVAKALKELGITAFDPLTGKMREQSEVFKDLMLSLSERNPIAQSKALSTIFSERGEKAAQQILNSMRSVAEESTRLTPEVEALYKASGVSAEEGVKQVKSFANAYEELYASIADNAGFAIIAAAEQSLTPLNQIRSVVATLQGSLVSAFDTMQPYLLQTTARLKAVFGSDEFKADVQSFVGLVGTATTLVVEHAKILATLGLSVVAVATGLPVLSVAMVAYTGATAAGATATGALGVAMTALAKHPLMYLAQGVIFAASAWATYKLNVKDASAAQSNYTGAGLEALVDSLEKEEERLNNVNEARRAGISLLEQEQKVKFATEQQKFDVELAAKRSELDKLNAPSATKDGDRLKAAGKAALQAEINALLETRGALVLRYEASIQGIKNARAEANQSLPGVKPPIAGTKDFEAISGKTVRERQFIDKFTKDSLASMASTAQSHVATLTNTYNTDRDILKNAHSNKLIDEGTYQAQSLAQLQKYEAEKLAALSEKDAAERQHVYDLYVENRAILDKEIGEYKGTVTEKEEFRKTKEKEFSALVLGVAEKLKSDLANSDEQRVQLTNEAYKRMTIAAQDYAGVVKKLDLQTDEQILDIRLKREAEEATQALARQYAGITESSMVYLRAQKAASEAQASATAEAQKHLEVVDKAIKLAIEAADSYARFLDEMSIPLTDEVLSAFKGMNAEIESLRRNRAKYSAEATTDISAAGKRAFDKIIAEDIQRLKTGTSDAIMTGLFEGGKAGRSSLRKLIVDELKKPVRLVVDAIVNTVFGAVLGGAGSSAAGSAIGSAGGSMIGSAIGATAVGQAGSYAATGFMNTVAGTGTSAGLTAGGAIGGMNGAAMQLGAVAPWLLGGLAVLSLLSSLDDSGTYHSGGLAGYSAAGGSLKGDAVKAAGLNFDLASKDYTASGETASEAIAKSVVSILDSTATAFGAKAGYYAATAFADDTSKDGAWGQLMVQLGDQILIDWKNGTDKWPGREFADGEAGAKEYAAAVAVAVRDQLVTQVPDWADATLQALGDAPTLETLGAAVTQINAAATALVSMGDASTAFASASLDATTLLVKALGGAESAAAKLGSYYTNFYSEEERKALATSALAEQLQVLGKELPTTRDAFRSMVDAAVAAGDTTLAAKLIDLNEAFAAITDSAESAATATEDLASSALDTLSSAVDKQKAAIQVTIDSASTLVTEVTGIFDLLTSSIAELRAEVVSPLLAVQSGNSFINSAIASATNGLGLPNQADLSTAITAARSGLGVENFSSLADQKFAKAELAGRLEILKGYAGNQLSAAEQMLDTAKSQLKDLDDTLEYWKAQVELSQGNLDAVVTVEQAIRDLIEVIQDPTGAKKAAESSAKSYGLPGYSSSASRLTLDDVPDYAKKDYVKVGDRYISTVAQDVTDAADYYAARLTQAYWSPEADMMSTWQQLLQSSFAGNSSTLIALARSAGLDENIIKSYEQEFMPKLAVGTNFIPRDGAYYLHKGEAVQPAAYNPAAGGSVDSETLAEIASQKAELVEIKNLLTNLVRSSFRSAEALNGNPEVPMPVVSA